MECFIALTPLAVYLSWIGLLPFYRRPVVRSGASDLLLLWLGVSGLVMVGPVKLLFPIGALMVWKNLAFVLVGTLYVLTGILVSGFRQSQLIVYNIREEDFQAFLEESAQKEELRVVGNCVLIPKLEIQFSCEIQPFWQCLVLRATSRNQSPAGWIQLERVLREKFAVYRTPLNVKASVLPLVSVLLFIILYFKPV